MPDVLVLLLQLHVYLLYVSLELLKAQVLALEVALKLGQLGLSDLINLEKLFLIVSPRLLELGLHLAELRFLDNDIFDFEIQNVGDVPDHRGQLYDRVIPVLLKVEAQLHV